MLTTIATQLQAVLSVMAEAPPAGGPRPGSSGVAAGAESPFAVFLRRPGPPALPGLPLPSGRALPPGGNDLPADGVAASPDGEAAAERRPDPALRPPRAAAEVAVPADPSATRENDPPAQEPAATALPAAFPAPVPAAAAGATADPAALPDSGNRAAPGLPVSRLPGEGISSSLPTDGPRAEDARGAGRDPAGAVTPLAADAAPAARETAAPAGPRPDPVLDAVLASLGREPGRTVAADSVLHASQTPNAAAHAGPAPGPAGAGAAAPLPAQAAPASAGLGVPVGDPGWADALGDRVMLMAGKHLQRAEIRLHPAELGPVHVRISVDDDGTTLAFTAHHAVTRDAIEQALPRLRELFADNGLSLGHATVADHGARQREHAGGGAAGGAPFGPAGNDPALAGDPEPGAAVARSLRAASQLVDTFA